MNKIGTDYRPRHSIDGDYVRLDVLQYIRDFIEDEGYSPSVRDIMYGCGFSSTSSVSHHLRVLREKGKITYQNNVARSVRIA